MSDQYLWDGSGEPDPEIEALERKLSAYKYAPVELKLPEVRSDRDFASRPFWRYAVAASIIAVFFLGVLTWISRNRHRVPITSAPIAEGTRGNGQSNVTPVPNKTNPEPKSSPRNSLAEVAPGMKPVRKPHSSAPSNALIARNVELPGVDQAPALNEHFGARSRLPSPFEVESAEHVEKAQMLLRSFKNSDDTGQALADVVAFDRDQAQRLLYQNIVLRRSAEMKGNVPLQDVLEYLEPFLLDIANLPDNAPQEDVRAIRDRIRSEEIVATLQAYAAPPARGW